MIVVIDNYDSFTFNLVQYIGEINPHITILRNDAVDLNALETLSIDRIVISPGPGRPTQAGCSMAVIRQWYTRVPILGVCLGHQAIGEVFGATIAYASSIMHGKTSPIVHTNPTIFNGVPSPFTATRYHSLIVDRHTVPLDTLAITAQLDDGTIMAIQHVTYPTIGIQFHPESILTDYGKTIIANFLKVPHP